MGEDSLATSLCTWSPNELAHLLSVINDPHTLLALRQWRIAEKMTKDA
jgi:hypothetical protein